MTATTTTLTVKEAEIVKLLLAFLSSRELHLAARSLERESGVVNGLFSDDVLFLRQLILDGQWDDVIEFIQPLESLNSFDYSRCKYLILKQKYLEMLCMKSEKDQILLNMAPIDFSIDEVVTCLHSMERICANKEEYNALCLLLTVPRLSEHPDYKQWNPSSARIQCFEDIRPLVERILPADKNLRQEDFLSGPDRLVQLLVQGLLYESCLDFCQRRASEDVKFGSISGNLLCGAFGEESDPSLLSWLESVPQSIFSCPFEQKTLSVTVSKMIKPPSASWCEQLLLTPTPAQLTPSMSKSLPSPAARFSSRPRTADRMSDVGATREPVATPRDTAKSFANFSYGAQVSIPRNLPDTIEEETIPQLNQSIAFPTPRKSLEPQIRSSTPRSSRDVSNQLSHPHEGPIFPSRSESEHGSIRSSRSNSRSHSDSHAPPVFAEDFNQPRMSFDQAYDKRLPPPHSYGVSDMEQIMSNVPPLHNSLRRNSSNPNHELSELYRVVATLEETQAVRCVAMHPSGHYAAVGANSKILRCLAIPTIEELRLMHDDSLDVMFKKRDYHKGSIYCVGWSPDGSLLATGSNDKVVKILRVNASTMQIEGSETEMTMHDGTVRDLVFAPASFSINPLLISGGAGDCNVYITDCILSRSLQAMAGHSGHILSLYAWSAFLIASGSQDKTIRLWDLRTPKCTGIIGSSNSPSAFDSAVAAVCVNSIGTLLACGHEHSSMAVFDLRASNRILHSLDCHSSDVRSARFSNSSPNTLLSASYDGKAVLTDLSEPTPYYRTVAKHRDKIIQTRWHPTFDCFITTSADRTASLWCDNLL